MMRYSKNKQFVRDLIDAHHHDLHWFLVRKLRHSRLEASDVAQETYLRLLRVDNVTLIRKPQSYLYQIAINVVRELQLKERTNPVDYNVDIDSTGENLAMPVNEIDGVEHTSSVKRLLSSMPVNHQAALLLLKRDGLSYQEIAAKLGISENTVKKYLFLAVRHCRNHGWR